MDDLLFEIERSTNRNVVVCAARRDATDGFRLDAAAPVDAYWRDVEPETLRQNAARGLGERSELTALERRLAYGFDVGPLRADGTAELRLRALPARPLTVGIDAKTGRAFAAAVSAKGELCTLHNVRVDVTERARLGLLPRVDGISLRGRVVGSGAPFSERLDGAGEPV
jgi:hypothetical protein